MKQSSFILLIVIPDKIGPDNYIDIYLIVDSAKCTSLENERGVERLLIMSLEVCAHKWIRDLADEESDQPSLDTIL